MSISTIKKKKKKKGVVWVLLPFQIVDGTFVVLMLEQGTSSGGGGQFT